MRIIDYAVITAPALDKLRDEVMHAIRRGWQPLGGFSAFPNAALQVGGMLNVSGISVIYAQGVVLYEAPSLI